MKPSILLVEDNPQDEALTLRALAKANIANQIDVVRDGAEAVDFLLRQGVFAKQADEPLPTVVMLDLKLPKLNGLEVLKIIRETPATRLLPVVILTSSDEEKDIVAAYSNGANSYVRKPVNFAEFGEAVARLGIYWLAINIPPKK